MTGMEFVHKVKLIMKQQKAIKIFPKFSEEQKETTTLWCSRQKNEGAITVKQLLQYLNEL